MKLLISGFGITMSSLPPYRTSLASISPIVLETDNLPGSTLKGPVNVYYPVRLPGVGSGMKLKF